MADKYVVFTEIVDKGGVERWYYGTYDESSANVVAYGLGHDEEQGIWHCVCRADEARKWGIKNLPVGFSY